MLKICSECKYSIVEDNVVICPNCGNSLVASEGGETVSGSTYDDEPVSSQCTLQDDDDDLGLQSTADLMEQTARSIGVQRPAEHMSASDEATDQGNIADEVVADPYNSRNDSNEKIDTNVTPNGVHKLTAEEVAQLSAALYDNADHLSEKERQELLSKVRSMQSTTQLPEYDRAADEDTIITKAGAVPQPTPTAAATPPPQTPAPPEPVRSSSQAVEPIAHQPIKPRPTTRPQPIAPVKAQPKPRPVAPVVEQPKPEPQPVQPQPSPVPQVAAAASVAAAAVAPSPTKETIPSEEDLPSPKMAARGRGIAFFWKNYIELRTTMEIKEGHELLINDREFELRKKRINPKVLMIGGGTAFVALVIWITTLVVSDPLDGRGRIVGVVLDQFGQPYLKEATLSLPAIDAETVSNAQGMFMIEDVPEGAHQLQISDDGLAPLTDYATVVSEKTTLVTIRLQPPTTASSPQASVNSNEPATSAAPPQKMPPRTEEVAQKLDESREARNSGPGKVALEASVDGAAFKLDGTTLGMGNLTYSRVSAGEHSYVVSKDGYKPVSGKIRVESGKTARVRVTLEPMSLAEKKKNYDAAALYRSALENYNRDNLDEALADLNAALEKDPGMVEAYVERGNVLSEQGNNQRAHDDYLRAAEIYRVRRDFPTSMITYNKALALNANSIPALLGRGDLFLAQGEELAALTDFDAVRRMDRGNAAAHFGMGEARFRQGRYDQAIDHFKDARDLDSSNPLIYQYLMLAYLSNRDEKDVRKTYEQFRKVASDQQIAEFWSNDRYASVHRALQ